jgi:hypothetical protein
MFNVARTLCLLFILAGCSSIPDVEYNYYFAKSQTSLSVAQAVSCDASKANLIVVTSASPPTTAYSADTSRGYAIRIRDIEGNFHTFVDSDATFGFYDDGRLKSINQNTIGQGEAVIKSAVSLATTAVPLFGARIAATPPAETDACKLIDKWGGGGADKVASVNLSYGTQFDITHVLGKSFEIPPTMASKQLHDMLQQIGANLPAVEVSIGRSQPRASRASYSPPAEPQDSVVELALQNTADVEIKILSAYRPIWKGTVVAPLPGGYTLPIPRGALFGKQNFTLSLSEAGAIQSIDYGKLSGASGALNAAQAVAGAGPQITANVVNDAKTKADEIAQTQRLMRCQTHPATCN